MGKYRHAKAQQAVASDCEKPAKAIQGEMDSCQSNAKPSPHTSAVQAEDSLNKILQHLYWIYCTHLLQAGKDFIKESGRNPIY